VNKRARIEHPSSFEGCLKRYSVLTKKRGEVRFRLGYNATKDDFDLTPANHIQTGSETERRNRGFLQPDATVGMD
jgi:hypothetical protein